MFQHPTTCMQMFCGQARPILTRKFRTLVHAGPYLTRKQRSDHKSICGDVAPPLQCCRWGVAPCQHWRAAGYNNRGLACQRLIHGNFLLILSRVVRVRNVIANKAVLFLQFAQLGLKVDFLDPVLFASVIAEAHGEGEPTSQPQQGSKVKGQYVQWITSFHPKAEIVKRLGLGAHTASAQIEEAMRPQKRHATGQLHNSCLVLAKLPGHHGPACAPMPRTTTIWKA